MYTVGQLKTRAFPSCGRRSVASTRASNVDWPGSVRSSMTAPRSRPDRVPGPVFAGQVQNCTFEETLRHGGARRFYRAIKVFNSCDKAG